MHGPAGYMLSYGVDGAARYMLGTAGYMVVAHVIIVSAQVLLVLTLGLWTLDLGLTILKEQFTLVDSVSDLFKKNGNWPVSSKQSKKA